MKFETNAVYFRSLPRVVAVLEGASDQVETSTGPMWECLMCLELLAYETPFQHAEKWHTKTAQPVFFHHLCLDCNEHPERRWKHYGDCDPDTIHCTKRGD